VDRELVLYGLNTFRLAHAKSVVHDRNLNYTVHATAPWLRYVEVRFSLLQTGTITVNEITESDIGTVRLSGHRFGYHHCIGVLPLLKLYWSDTSGNLQIRFTDTLQIAQMLEDRSSSQLYRPFDTFALHNVLKRPGKADIWNLKKSRRFFRSIIVSRHSDYGYLRYKADGSRIGFSRRFIIIEAGNDLKMFYLQRLLDFLHCQNICGEMFFWRYCTPTISNSI
jgi:hypothetical protein